jgi:hypothetical protein
LQICNEAPSQDFSPGAHTWATHSARRASQYWSASQVWNGESSVPSSEQSKSVAPSQLKLFGLHTQFAHKADVVPRCVQGASLAHTSEVSWLPSAEQVHTAARSALQRVLPGEHTIFASGTSMTLGTSAMHTFLVHASPV